MGRNVNRKAPEALWQLLGAFRALRVLTNTGLVVGARVGSEPVHGVDQRIGLQN